MNSVCMAPVRRLVCLWTIQQVTWIGVTIMQISPHIHADVLPQSSEAGERAIRISSVWCSDYASDIDHVCLNEYLSRAMAPTFLAPVTNFVEDSFSMDLGGEKAGMVWG